MRPTPERRAQYRAMAEHKAPRRMQLADDVGLLWESRATIEHQIEQMLEMEEEPDAQHAIRRSYGELMPDASNLAATLFIEVRDPQLIKQRLAVYAGIEHAIRLRVGTHDIRPRLVGDHGNEAAATAVTYLRFPVPDDLAGARLIVDHPALRTEQPLPPAVVAEPA